ncbi:DUF3549 family protein [Shewanella yunxiaonensis]|uniref:DUF3549 family protein n=1 Tax=Shewanella yunxiaonensis TaxID=2829809 RepID=A0ABX7YRC2_9GAMM|nr:DUF3549 family protein [Shewanella yunxiaonensis]QUN04894.1 DUF3549 family protein [Shewanella yunxiaonensis]
MHTISTFGELLNAANSQYLIYDMGRRVQSIDVMAFRQIEALTAPYPYPIQGHACFALVFWERPTAPFIWFLKLPLDEQGLLNPAGRSQFIEMLLEAMGTDLKKELTEAQQQQLASHPFSFRPSQEKLALFNALVRRQLGQPASAQYEYACQYLSGNDAAQHWQAVGLQGLADVCARAEQLEHPKLLAEALGSAAVEVRIALCQMLEHVTISKELAAKISAYLPNQEATVQSYYLRALASQPDSCATAIETSVKEEAWLSRDMLLAIAARCWMVLKQEQCRKIFLESLARQPLDFFITIFADIVAIPAIRTVLLGELRNPERSVQLSTAIGGLFRNTQR